MGSAHSSDKKNMAAELVATSSSEEDDESQNWREISRSDSGYSQDEEDSSDGEDADVEERLRILRESRKLRMLAEFFYHPEKPIVCDPTVFARSYFDRPSAVDPVEEDNAEEAARILEEMKSLKKLAVDYQHPEHPVETLAAACARCYFDRASAPQPDGDDDDDERALILEDLNLLKKAAFDYLHPEVPIQTTMDPTVFGRNYFTRPSALERTSGSEEAEKQLILDDTKVLRKLARDYQHPELPVPATDPAVFGRNYYSRPSAHQQQGAVEEVERRQILEDARRMKQLAVDYRHPELPVVTDPAVFGRNYFNNKPAWAADDEAERKHILEDAKALYKLAVDYLHPEIPVCTDPAAFGRNYFSRPSSSPQTDREEEEECLNVKEDSRQLKTLAVVYRHPELPVGTSPTACARNFFDRPSAIEQDFVDEEERRQVLEDARRMEQLAVDYRHPELPVVTSPTACARNFFDRPSAIEQAAWEQEEEQEQALVELHRLEQFAIDYHHPEIPVTTGRFDRPSAAELTHHFDVPATPEGDQEDEMSEYDDFYYHHAHFDMEDDLHLHHVDFDRNMAHHDEITEVRVATSGLGFNNNDSLNKLSSSPGCVMTFVHPKKMSIPPPFAA